MDEPAGQEKSSMQGEVGLLWDCYSQLAALLICPLCKEIMKDPHGFHPGCGHAFCLSCVCGTLEGPGITRSCCPVCHAPVWKKDLKPYHTVASLSERLVNLQHMLHGEGTAEPTPAQPVPAAASHAHAAAAQTAVTAGAAGVGGAGPCSPALQAGTSGLAAGSVAASTHQHERAPACQLQPYPAPGGQAGCVDAAHGLRAWLQAQLHNNLAGLAGMNMQHAGTAAAHAQQPGVAMNVNGDRAAAEERAVSELVGLLTCQPQQLQAHGQQPSSAEQPCGCCTPATLDMLERELDAMVALHHRLESHIAQLRTREQAAQPEQHLHSGPAVHGAVQQHCISIQQQDQQQDQQQRLQLQRDAVQQHSSAPSSRHSSGPARASPVHPSPHQVTHAPAAHSTLAEARQADAPQLPSQQHEQQQPQPQQQQQEQAGSAAAHGLQVHEAVAAAQPHGKTAPVPRAPDHCMSPPGGQQGGAAAACIADEAGPVHSVSPLPARKRARGGARRSTAAAAPAPAGAPGAAAAEAAVEPSSHRRARARTAHGSTAAVGSSAPAGKAPSARHLAPPPPAGGAAEGRAATAHGRRAQASVQEPAAAAGPQVEAQGAGAAAAAAPQSSGHAPDDRPCRPRSAEAQREAEHVVPAHQGSAVAARAAAAARTNHQQQFLAGGSRSHAPTSSQPHRPVVLAMVSVDADLKRQLTAFCKRLHGAVVGEDVTRETTHVVVGCDAQGYASRRTFKYLAGLLQGCHMVQHSWATASMSAGTWQEEPGFLVQGDPYTQLSAQRCGPDVCGSLGGPARARARKLKGAGLQLFEGLHFHLVPATMPDEEKRRGVLALLQLGGAAEVQRPPKRNLSQGSEGQSAADGAANAPGLSSAAGAAEAAAALAPTGSGSVPGGPPVPGQVVLLVGQDAQPEECAALAQRWGLPPTLVDWVKDSVTQFLLLPLGPYHARGPH